MELVFYGCVLRVVWLFRKSASHFLGKPIWGDSFELGIKNDIVLFIGVNHEHVADGVVGIRIDGDRSRWTLYAHARF